MADHPDIRKRKCPRCGQAFTYVRGEEPKCFPFCSERCQWVDLGAWLDGEYRVSRDLTSRDLEEDD